MVWLKCDILNQYINFKAIAKKPCAVEKIKQVIDKAPLSRLVNTISGNLF